MDGRLLVVEDDPQVRAMLTRALAYEGFEVDAAGDAGSAMAAIRAAPPDLILLDLLLPDDDGVEVCRRLRASGARLPILMVTARDTVSDRVEGLESGADDYLVKPFSTAELVARVRALLRRARTVDGPRQARAYADLHLDASTHEVRRGHRHVELTRREFDLLALLLDNPETVMPRERLLTEAWGYTSAVETNSLDVYVGYLRRKLEEDGESRLIHTVRGVGFVLRRAPEA
ncbi:response regulator transcription factor [Miltoncostaea oceani]|uniref:response regulator transcription factor n=1 Tax=Miltoncostaea oceani TaxID=2843216 RepID=UPI001C3D0A92|nr:response regulator transcription factor [Miltoncostaea oceani]